MKRYGKIECYGRSFHRSIKNHAFCTTILLTISSLSGATTFGTMIQGITTFSITTISSQSEKRDTDRKRQSAHQHLVYRVILSVIMPNVVLLSVIMLNVVLLSVIMLNVVLLSVIMLNVSMLSVVVPSLPIFFNPSFSPFLLYTISSRTLSL
jgi:hypothetical protein